MTSSLDYVFNKIDKIEAKHKERVNTKYKYKMPDNVLDEISVDLNSLTFMFYMHLLLYTLALLLFGHSLTFLMSIDWKLTIIAVLSTTVLKRAILHGVIKVYYPKETPSSKHANLSILAIFFWEGSIVRTFFNTLYFCFLLIPMDDALRGDVLFLKSIVFHKVSLFVLLLLVAFYVYKLFYSDRRITQRTFTENSKNRINHSCKNIEVSKGELNKNKKKDTELNQDAKTTFRRRSRRKGRGS